MVYLSSDRISYFQLLPTSIGSVGDLVLLITRFGGVNHERAIDALHGTDVVLTAKVGCTVSERCWLHHGLPCCKHVLTMFVIRPALRRHARRRRDASIIFVDFAQLIVQCAPSLPLVDRCVPLLRDGSDAPNKRFR